MELTRSARPAALERCPYCHDQLEAPGEERTECPGCGTRHHQVCLEELGRCSIMGCERSLAPRRPTRRPESGRLREQVRERIRRRLQGFVRDHVQRPTRAQPEGSPAPQLRQDAEAVERREEYERVLEVARQAALDERWQAAAEAYGRLASVVRMSRPGDLDPDRTLDELGALMCARQMNALGQPKLPGARLQVGILVASLALSLVVALALFLHKIL